MTYNLSIAGWMTEYELQQIEALASRVPVGGRMIEVGSFHGRSSWVWSKSVPDGVTVHCIDPWDNSLVRESYIRTLEGVIPPKRRVRMSLESFLDNTKDCDNITFTHGFSGDVLPTLPRNHYDLIFLDGCHENPVFGEDVRQAVPLLKSGGILCGHDFQPGFPDIMAEITTLAETFNRPILFTPPSTIWSIEVP